MVLAAWVSAAVVWVAGQMLGGSPSHAQAEARRPLPEPAAPSETALTGHGGPVRAVAALEPGEVLVTGGFDGAIIVWSLGLAPVARAVLRHHDSTVNALSPLPDGCFASGGEDGRLAIWCGGAEPVGVLNGHTAPISALVMSPDGKTLASASWDHTVRLWPLNAIKTGEVASPVLVEGHKGPVNGVAFLPNGSAIVTAGYDGQLRVTPLEKGMPRTDGKALASQADAPVNAVAVLPDGSLVAAGADGKLSFQDVGPRGTSLTETASIDLGLGPLTTVAVAPDGATIATAGMRTPVTLIDTQSRTVRAQILGPGLPVWSVAFAGRTLVTGGADRAVRRWDPRTGSPAGADVTGAVEDQFANDPHPGARVFRACRACHGLTERDIRAGPTLHAIMGRRIGTVPGYNYSDALKRRDIVWTPETVAKLFEVGPNAYLPGTKMPEQTISSAADRNALVEWLSEKTGGGTSAGRP